MGEDAGPAPIIVVTGTGIRVDTTLAAAALTVGLRDEGLEVTVTTPVRTGATGTNSLRRLSDLTGGTHVHESITLAAELPPRDAARAGGIVLPPVMVHAAEWARLLRRPELDVLLVDDPEGILAELDEDGSCLLDAADAAEGWTFGSESSSPAGSAGTICARRASSPPYCAPAASTSSVASSWTTVAPLTTPPPPTPSATSCPMRARPRSSATSPAGAWLGSADLPGPCRRLAAGDLTGRTRMSLMSRPPVPRLRRLHRKHLPLPHGRGRLAGDA